MLLLEIRDYIHRRGEVTLQELSRQFTILDSAMLDMVKRWVDKGVIAQEILSSECRTSCVSSCGGCSAGKNTQQVVKFYWKGESEPRQA